MSKITRKLIDYPMGILTGAVDHLEDQLDDLVGLPRRTHPTRNEEERTFRFIYRRGVLSCSNCGNPVERTPETAFCLHCGVRLK